HTCEGSCRGSHILKIAKRHPEFVVTNVARPDVHHTVGTIDRQTSDAERIDDREQCIVDANAEPQCEDCDKGEPTVFREQAGGETKVLQDVPEPRPDPNITSTV